MEKELYLPLYSIFFTIFAKIVESAYLFSEVVHSLSTAVRVSKVLLFPLLCHWRQTTMSVRSGTCVWINVQLQSDCLSKIIVVAIVPLMLWQHDSSITDITTIMQSQKGLRWSFIGTPGPISWYHNNHYLDKMLRVKSEISYQGSPL